MNPHPRNEIQVQEIVKNKENCLLYTNRKIIMKRKKIFLNNCQYIRQTRSSSTKVLIKVCWLIILPATLYKPLNNITSKYRRPSSFSKPKLWSRSLISKHSRPTIKLIGKLTSFGINISKDSPKYSIKRRKAFNFFLPQLKKWLNSFTNRLIIPITEPLIKGTLLMSMHNHTSYTSMRKIKPLCFPRLL